MSVLRAEGIGYVTGGRALVEGVTVALEPGQVAVVVGPNGAGKSTLMRLLSGELAPTSGRVLYGSEPVAALPAWRLATMRAVLPQSASLAFPFSVAEVARIGVDGIGRGLGRADREAILARALRRADVAHLAGRSYQSLSGGERARAQFARALCQIEAGRTVSRRQILFLDEPTASLDPRHQAAVLEIAAELAREGVAVIAVLHDLNLAAAYAERLLVLNAGRLVAAGAPAAILDDRLIARVFGVPWRVRQVPPEPQPFLIPCRDVAH